MHIKCYLDSVMERDQLGDGRIMKRIFKKLY
jgi:hypothetical protein